MVHIPRELFFLPLFSEIEPLLRAAADGGHEEAKRALIEMYPENY